MWYLLQNTEATALTAKRQTDFALGQLDCKQHCEHRMARYPVIVSFGKQFNRHNICSKSHFLPDVLAPLCANPIFNCEQIKLANCSSAMPQLVNSMHRKPRAQSPSIGIIIQRTLPITSVLTRRLLLARLLDPVTTDKTLVITPLILLLMTDMPHNLILFS